MSEDTDIPSEENVENAENIENTEPQEEKSELVQRMEENKKKYEFIEDLPGVGPATAAKLRELGYHTVESLAMATSRELDPVGVSEKKAFQNH